MKRNCNSYDFTFFEMQRTKRVIHHLLHNDCSAVTSLHFKLCLSPFGQHRNDYTYRNCVFISFVILKNRTYLPRTSLWHILTRCAFVESLIILSLQQRKPSISAFECQCCSDWAVSEVLEISQVAFLAHGCRHETAAEDAAVLPSSTDRRSQQSTVCRQCTTCPLSESLSNLCFCFRTRASAVSQQVQSASVSVNSDQVTEQPSRCKLSVKKIRKQLCVHILNSLENPAVDLR